jgi:SRSO17 transposase
VRLPRGKQDPAFRTKPVIALALIERAQGAGIPFRAVVADNFYGDNGAFEDALLARGVPHVLGHKWSLGRCWAPAEEAHSFEEAARDLPRGAWTKVVRRFTDGHEETWWAAELTFAGYRPTDPVRAIVATTDRAALPALSTWALTTNLSRGEAPLAEVVRLYGLRVWVEEGYKRVKQDLGWADFMVRSSRAIRRHWALVSCAFSFCWWHEARASPDGQHAARTAAPQRPPARHTTAGPARGKNRPAAAPALLARRAAPRARLARPGRWLARCWRAWTSAPPPPAGTRGAARRRRRRARTPPLPPDLTNYR